MSEVKQKPQIKAQDLRINNLVTIDNPEYWPALKDIPMRVTGTRQGEANYFPESTGSVTLEHDNKKTYSQVDEFIKGIPLSEEWLIRMGFEKKPIVDGFFKYETQHVILHMPFTIYLPYFEFTYNDGDDSTELKHVHQLQNLFYTLTGTELTISESLPPAPKQDK